jgi:hypothetical protein
MQPRDTGKRKEVQGDGNDRDRPSHNHVPSALDVLRVGASERMRLRSPGPEHKIWELPDMSDAGLDTFLAGQQSHREADQLPDRGGLRSLVSGTRDSAKGWYRDGERSKEERKAANNAAYKKKHKVRLAANNAAYRANPKNKARDNVYCQAYQQELKTAQGKGIDKEEAQAAARSAGNAATARWNAQHVHGGEARACGEGVAREEGPVAGSSTGARERRESQQKQVQKERDAEMARGLAAGQAEEEGRQWGAGGASGGAQERREGASGEGRSEPRSGQAGKQARKQERARGAQEEPNDWYQELFGSADAKLEAQTREEKRARAAENERGRAETHAQVLDQAWFAQNPDTIWVDRGNGTPNEPRRTVRVTEGDGRLQRAIRTDVSHQRYRSANLEEIKQYEAWEQQAAQRGLRSSSLGGALGKNHR